MTTQKLKDYAQEELRIICEQRSYIKENAELVLIDEREDFFESVIGYANLIDTLPADAFAVHTPRNVTDD